MSELAIAGDVVSRARKERIHTTMLIELLALLVFMAMAFAFVLKEEGDRTNPWREKALRLEREVEDLTRQNSELRKQVAGLRIQVRDLEAANRMLAAQHSGTVLPSGMVVLPATATASAAAERANLAQLVEELQRDNARLRAEVDAARGGKSGAGRPKCAVTAGFLLAIELEGDDTFRVRPAWKEGAADAARQVPGVMQLATGAPLSRGQFGSLASQVSAWAGHQPIPCTFSVTVTERHSSLSLYKKQVAAVEQYFYVARR